LWVVWFCGGLGVWGLFCVGWPKKCWMAMRCVACVSDTEDSVSYIHLYRSKRRDPDRAEVVAVIER